MKGSSTLTLVTPVLECDRVAHRYGGRPGLGEISLCVEPGSLVALTGSNGSGKSTLLKISSGLIAPSSGRAALWGREPVRDREIRRRIGYLGHELGLYDELTVFENLVFFARLHGLSDSEPVEKALLRFAITERRDSLVRSLSRGLKERTALARVSLHDPDLYLLDEPATGLDRDSRAALTLWMGAVKAEGKTVFFSTHEGYIQEARPDRVVTLAAAA